MTDTPPTSGNRTYTTCRERNKRVKKIVLVRKQASKLQREEIEGEIESWRRNAGEFWLNWLYEVRFIIVEDCSNKINL